MLSKTKTSIGWGSYCLTTISMFYFMLEVITVCVAEIFYPACEMDQNRYFDKTTYHKAETSFGDHMFKVKSKEFSTCADNLMTKAQYKLANIDRYRRFKTVPSESTTDSNSEGEQASSKECGLVGKSL